MEPTTGFAAEGLFRQLMPSALGTIGFIVFIFIATAVVKSFLHQAKLSGGLATEGMSESLSWLNWAKNGLIFLSLIYFVWNAILVTTVNQVPRVDLDGSAITEQMQQNIKK